MTAAHHEDSAVMPLYLPPRQRQRWGDSQLAPHTDWGDIFFDLFYVAAAYNLGSLLREDPTRRGLLYVCGCFLPIIFLWTQKMGFSARFYLANDIFHRLYEVAALLPLATAIWEIRTVAVLSRPREYRDVFVYCLSIFIAQCVVLFRYIEIMVAQKVYKKYLHPEAYNTGLMTLVLQIPTTVLFLAATVYAGLQYEGTEYVKDEYMEKGTYNSTTTDSSFNGDHRYLAESTTSSLYSDTGHDDTAMWLCIGGSVAYLTVAGFYIGVIMQNRKEQLRKYSVPMNVSYSIHRFGEWVMLMLGESILSLLIVDIIETSEYYQVFFCGIISTVLLQFLHFSSQPHNPDLHALRRDTRAGFSFTLLMMIYSISLVILGTCLKMFLYESVFAQKAAKDEYDSSSDNAHRVLSPLMRRFLAGGESAALRFSTEDRQQRIAHFFSGSLALVWLCLDGMSLAHIGIDNKKDIYRNIPGTFLKCAYWIVLAFRIGLVCYFATLSQWETRPKALAWQALFGTVLNLFSKAFVNIYFPCSMSDDHHDSSHDDLIERYAKARAREADMERKCKIKAFMQ